MNYINAELHKCEELKWVQISALASVGITTQMLHFENQILRSTKNGVQYAINFWFLDIKDALVVIIRSQEVESSWHEAVEVNATSLRANQSEMDWDIH